VIGSNLKAVNHFFKTYILMRGTVIVPFIEMVPQMLEIRLWKWSIEVLTIYDKVIAQHI
jgi:hypothetical protein